jgi:hypothetical protein
LGGGGSERGQGHDRWVGACGVQLWSPRINTIVSIRLWKIKAGDEGIRSVCNFLNKNLTVTILDVMDNGLTPLGRSVLSLGCEFLGGAMHPASNVTLKKLMLDHNLIGTSGLQNLCSGLLLVT